jgi:uncharacterized protein YjbJ (UPF0337 family)
MNSDVFRGKWNQIKGQLKNKWGKVTDDEWTQINGSKDMLIGKLQERYGRSRDEIAREVDNFLIQFNAPQHAQAGATGTRDVGDEPNMRQPQGQLGQQGPKRKVG